MLPRHRRLDGTAPGLVDFVHPGNVFGRGLRGKLMPGQSMLSCKLSPNRVFKKVLHLRFPVKPGDKEHRMRVANAQSGKAVGLLAGGAD